MSEPEAMTMRRGKCQIYPKGDTDFCVRVKVLVVPLKPEEEFTWIGGETLRDGEVTCALRGLKRLLDMIDSAMKPPAKRPREATSDA